MLIYPVFRTLHTLRQIPAKRQDILYPCCFQGLHLFPYTLFGGIYACQMCQRRNVRIFNIGSDRRGISTGTSGCSIGHTHKIRLQRRDLIRSFLYTVIDLTGLRREHLQRQGWLSVLKNLRYFHNLLRYPDPFEMDVFSSLTESQSSFFLRM